MKYTKTDIEKIAMKIFNNANDKESDYSVQVFFNNQVIGRTPVSDRNDGEITEYIFYKKENYSPNNYHSENAEFIKQNIITFTSDEILHEKMAEGKEPRWLKMLCKKYGIYFEETDAHEWSAISNSNNEWEYTEYRK